MKKKRGKSLTEAWAMLLDGETFEHATRGLSNYQRKYIRKLDDGRMKEGEAQTVSP